MVSEFCHWFFSQALTELLLLLLSVYIPVIFLLPCAPCENIVVILSVNIEILVSEDLNLIVCTMSVQTLSGPTVNMSEVTVVPPLPGQCRQNLLITNIERSVEMNSPGLGALVTHFIIGGLAIGMCSVVKGTRTRN